MTKNWPAITLTNIPETIRKGRCWIALAFFFALPACSSDTEFKEDTTATLKTNTIQTKKDTITPNEPALTEQISIEALGNDTASMRYSEQELHVKANTEVTLTLENRAEDLAMLHNVVITPVGSAEAIAQTGKQIGASGNYIPNSPEVLAASPLAKPGQTVTFTFAAPPPGEYRFICTYPGHYPKMQGKMTVE